VKVLHSVDELPQGLRFALTIGMFDGVHRGHQRAIDALIRVAARQKAKSVALTFDPHPSAVLRGSAPPQLCPAAEKLGRLEAAGVDITVVQPFDLRFADQDPEHFLQRLSAGRELAAVVMTAESAFGRDRAGIMPVVRRLGRQMGFRVVEVKRLETDGGALSSTRLRGLVVRGRLADAQRLLGRRYAVTGTVVSGDRRGRTLGFPTANLAFDDPVALPPDGIYAVTAQWGGKDPLRPTHSALGVASLGVRPTFGGGVRLLEAYLFDFSGNIYGKRLRIEFVRRLRGEKKFATVDALVRQMTRDAARARAILSSTSAPAGQSPPAR